MIYMCSGAKESLIFIHFGCGSFRKVPKNADVSSYLGNKRRILLNTSKWAYTEYYDKFHDLVTICTICAFFFT